MCYMGDVLKRYHVIDLLLYVRFFVHRSRKSISSIVLYPTRGNAIAFGFKWGCAKALFFIVIPHSDFAERRMTGLIGAFCGDVESVICLDRKRK